MVARRPPGFWDGGERGRQRLGREPQRELDFGLDADEEAAVNDGGNPLLAAWGRPGQDLFRQMLDLGIEAEAEDFVEPNPASLLGKVQRDVLEMRDGTTEPQPSQPCESIHWTSCHSPEREVEALRDYLLDCFERLPGLRPRDVLVLTPDIEVYAGAIEATFGKPEPGLPALHFSVADRAPRRDLPGIDAFFHLLELVDQRLNAREVYDFLCRPTLRARMGWSDTDLGRLREWIGAAGVRWGLSREERQRSSSLEAPTTWADGLGRLLLGWAAGEAPGLIWRGLAPSVSVGSGEAELLDGLIRAVELLEQTVADLREPRPAAEWPDLLETVRERLFTHDDRQDAEAADAIHRGIERLRAELGAAEGLLDCRTARQALEALVEPPMGGGGFLRGGITFCEMRPLRNVPARVIAVLGLNDGTFPRSGTRPEFHAIRKAERRVGDSFPDELDRFLLLETLLAARERLYLSHCGQSPREGSEQPPASVLTELHDYLDAAYPGALPPPRAPERRAMHPFGRAEFAEPPRSYSSRFASIARRLTQPPSPGQALVDAPLPDLPPEDPRREFSLGGLAQALVNPLRFFLTERLKMDLRTRFEALEEVDALEVDGLQAYQLRRDLLDQLLRHESPEAARERHQAAGWLPVGEAGEVVFDRALFEARPLASAAEAIVTTRQPRWENLHTRFARTPLSDRLGPLYGDALLLLEAGKLDSKRRIRAWLQHLAASAFADIPATTHLLCTDAHLCLQPLDPNAARATLEALLDHALGCLNQPRALLPDTTYAWAEARFVPSPNARTTPDQKAHTAYRDEVANLPETLLCYPEAPPLDLQATAQLGQALWKDFFAAQLAENHSND